jgi:aromatic-L-amino-acid/L-tryptophan decarboxylase
MRNIGPRILRTQGGKRVKHTSMFAYDEKMADAVFEYCRRRLALDPVPLDFGGARRPDRTALDGLLSEGGRGAEEVLAIFADALSTSILSCDSARYLAFIPAAPTKAALLFDMIVACSSFPCTSWFEGAGVVVAENQALRLLADAAGLPAEAGGCFVSGGSAANLSALVVARDTASQRRNGRVPAHPKVALSAEAHASVGLALRVIGVEALVVPTEDHRLTGRGLEAALAGLEDPESVIAVVATAGTTNAGIIDDLDGVACVAESRGLWFHVDGAYGGAALLVEEMRHQFAGIERVDSLVIDPHKWLFAPYDCAALLYREPRYARDVFTQKASYLDVLHAYPDDDWNPGDYAFHLTRRARGLPFWFSLAVNGVGAYRQAIATALHTARACAAMIAARAELELLRDPDLSVVLFRRHGWDQDAYLRWSARLLTEQTALVTPTTWDGEPAARLAFLHPDTTLDLVGEILDSMR